MGAEYIVFGRAIPTYKVLCRTDHPAGDTISRKQTAVQPVPEGKELLPTTAAVDRMISVKEHIADHRGW